LSNAYYVKYQKTYERRGFEPRPVLRDLRVHGRKLGPCLGFYPVQLEAYKALVKALCSHYDILIQCPLDSKGDLIRGVSEYAKNGLFSGVVCHYHLTTNKIDCANLELKKVLSEIE